MADNRKQPRNIESKQLYLVTEKKNEQQGRSTMIRVVDWIAEGKHYPQLEKREFFTDDQGEWKMGKAKGFTRNDLLLVQDKWGEIMAALGSTLPEDQRKPAPAAAAPTAPTPPATAPQEDF